MSELQHLLARLDRLVAIGIALSAERDHGTLLETILLGAKEITGADGGTLYTVTDDRHLRFEIMHTSSLGLAMRRDSGQSIPFAPIALHDADGSPNHHMVAAYCVLNDCTVNIEDAYQAAGFDFSGTRSFDRQSGYRSQSLLAIPLRNHDNEIIGVLQLLNALDPASGRIVPFSADSQQLAEALASQAAVALTNHHLVEDFRRLFESLIQLIAAAIDEKSPYTGGHCRRVPELAMLLADAANRCQHGPLRAFCLDEQQRYELRIAAWLHDCGKITTPEHIVDKPTKLATIFDRIALIEQRFELLKKQRECELLREQLDACRAGRPADAAAQQQAFHAWACQLDDDLAFLRRVNLGSEQMAPQDQARVAAIAAYPFCDAAGRTVPFLSDDEVYNLGIVRGTLTPEERAVINNHIVATINMLESLPYPRHLRRVPEYAGGHHERMDGRGYPRGLTRDEMSIPARIMGIADIFEALTAGDRPYKKANTLSEALAILGRMKLEQHVDPDLFDLFVRDKIYLQYARAFLPAAQIDAVDESKIPGYVP